MFTFNLHAVVSTYIVDHVNLVPLHFIIYDNSSSQSIVFLVAKQVNGSKTKYISSLCQLSREYMEFGGSFNYVTAKNCDNQPSMCQVHYDGYLIILNVFSYHSQLILPVSIAASYSFFRPQP